MLKGDYKMIKKVIKLILIIICMTTIFMFSSDNAEKSTKKSDGLIIKISEIVMNKKLSTKEKEELTSKFIVPVRKGAHFTIYFILGILVLSYIKEYTLSNKKAFMISIEIVFLYALSDELHQLFVPGRSGEILDIIIDTSGAVISNILYIEISKWRKRLNEQKKATS